MNPVLRVAAKALIVNDDGQCLLLRESSTKPDGCHPNRYQLPGGRVEAGETFIEGLHREVLEETGLRVEVDVPLYVGEWHPVLGGLQHRIVGVFVLCRPVIHPAVQLSQEHDQWRWVNPADHALFDVVPPEGQAIEAYLRIPPQRLRFTVKHRSASRTP